MTILKRIAEVITHLFGLSIEVDPLFEALSHKVQLITASGATIRCHHLLPGTMIAANMAISHFSTPFNRNAEVKLTGALTTGMDVSHTGVREQPSEVPQGCLRHFSKPQGE